MSGWLVVIAAYLLGSISSSYLVVRWTQGLDIRTVGSGNAGATNVLRAAGKGAGLTVFLFDAGKGFVAVVAAEALGQPPSIVAFAGLAAVLGHVYPVYFGLVGGKGVATAAGALIALAPLASLAMAGVFVLVTAMTRYVAVGSTVAALLAAPTIWGFGRLGITAEAQPASIGLATALAILIVGRHRVNYRRLAAGTEAPLGRAAGEGLDP